MSRIDEALRRARGEEIEPASVPTETDAPWEFAEGRPLTAARPAPPPPEEELAANPTATLRGDEPLLRSGQVTGQVPDSGLFVSLDGDEKMYESEHVWTLMSRKGSAMVAESDDETPQGFEVSTN